MQPRHAAAQGLATRDVWQAPESCPAPQNLRATAEGAASRAWVVVREVVGEAQPRWTATIHAEYAGGKGRRELSAKTCAELQSVVVIALSLIDPALVTPPSEPGTSGPAEPLTPVAPAAAAPSDRGSTEPLIPVAPAAPDASAVGSTPKPPSPSPDAAPELLAEPAAMPWRRPASDPLQPARSPGASVILRDVTLRPVAAGEQGVRPSLALGVGSAMHDTATPMLGAALELAVRWQRWRARVELGARTTLSAFETQPGVRVELLLAAARLELCHAWQPRAFEVWLCAGPLLQRLRASAPSLAAPLKQSVILPGGGTTVRGEWFRQTRVGWWAAAQVELRYHRVDYTVLERGQVGNFGRFSVVLLAGPQLRF